MRLRFVFGVLPAVVLYNANLPEGVVGSARLFVTMIREGFENDESIVRHELKHVEQFYGATIIGALVIAVLLMMTELLIYPWCAGTLAAIFVHPLAYRLSRLYRSEAEGVAFTEQTRHPDRFGNYMTRELAAAHLMGPRYDLNLTAEQAQHFIN